MSNEETFLQDFLEIMKSCFPSTICIVVNVTGLNLQSHTIVSPNGVNGNFCVFDQSRLIIWGDICNVTYCDNNTTILSSLTVDPLSVQIKHCLIIWRRVIIINLKSKYPVQFSGYIRK